MCTVLCVPWDNSNWITLFTPQFPLSFLGTFVKLTIRGLRERGGGGEGEEEGAGEETREWEREGRAKSFSFCGFPN